MRPSTTPDPVTTEGASDQAGSDGSRRPLTGRGRRRIVTGPARFNINMDARSALVAAVTMTVILVLGVAALALGDFPVSAPDVIGAFTGQTRGIERIAVLEWRLPRAFGAVAFGAALAVAGALFQTITRNPLASPDIIGLANGSFTGMLVALLALGGSWPLLTAGSLAGGLLAAGLIYVLAYRGGLQGFRFIVVGIGVSAMLASLNTWMLLRVELETALFASAWGAGSLNGVTGKLVFPAVACILGLLALVPLISRPLRQLDLGDDAAAATGVNVGRTRLAAIGIGVALVSSVTAVAGPIVFIALAAPQITRRLAGTPGIPLGTTAAVGGALLLAADIVSQHVLPYTVPVGVVTIVLGGAYLVGLLLYESKRRH